MFRKIEVELNIIYKSGKQAEGHYIIIARKAHNARKKSLMFSETI